jgi:LacI family transcriptional regulator
MKKRTSASSRANHVPHVLLLVDTAGAFGRSIIKGIGRYALENGPWSIRFVYRALDSLPPEWLNEWQGDGIISRTVNVRQARILQKTKLPVVELHGHPKIGDPQIRIDAMTEGRMAVEHFLSCGLRHFGFFSYGEVWWMKLHRDPFSKVLRESGYDCHCYIPPASRESLPDWKESQRPGLVKWLQSLPRPIGIFCPGDIHSVFLLDMCQELNIPVPEEIAILGAGNDPVICETVRPTLSSIDPDSRRMGYEAARLLDQMMAGKHTKDVIYIQPCNVVARQSTDLLAIGDADVARALRIIREYACKDINVSRVANEVGLSRRALERRFRQYVGRTPKGEIMRLRIERAKTLMAKTDHTSESIAIKSGFSSLEYFTKVLHRKVGMKPQAYRKMRRISRDLGNAVEN